LCAGDKVCPDEGVGRGKNGPENRESSYVSVKGGVFQSP